MTLFSLQRQSVTNYQTSKEMLKPNEHEHLIQPQLTSPLWHPQFCCNTNTNFAMGTPLCSSMLIITLQLNIQEQDRVSEWFCGQSINSMKKGKHNFRSISNWKILKQKNIENKINSWTKQQKANCDTNREGKTVEDAISNIMP